MTAHLKFETAFEALKLEAAKVEAKEATLDDAIAAFEAGMKHYAACLKILDSAEQRIQMVINGELNATEVGQDE